MAPATQTAVALLAAIPLVLQVQLALAPATQTAITLLPAPPPTMATTAAAPPAVVGMEVAAGTGVVGNVLFFGSSLRDKVAITQLRQCSPQSASPSRNGS